MKIRLWQIIIFVVLALCTIAFGLLKQVWSGFTYFSMTSVFLLAILFIINRILYIVDLKKDYDDNLDLYLAEMLNTGMITRAQFEERDERIIKGYYKQYNKTKNLQILILTLTFLILASIIVVLIRI
ncbi:MAG: hypothetical protein MR024_00730 [Firmicutes bacterium]|nr:hypothetical protein [Bacillota bacterium]